MGRVLHVVGSVEERRAVPCRWRGWHYAPARYLTGRACEPSCRHWGWTMSGLCGRWH